jgi:hypothetical protein
MLVTSRNNITGFPGKTLDVPRAFACIEGRPGQLPPRTERQANRRFQETRPAVEDFVQQQQGFGLQVGSRGHESDTDVWQVCSLPAK